MDCCYTFSPSLSLSPSPPLPPSLRGYFVQRVMVIIYGQWRRYCRGTSCKKQITIRGHGKHDRGYFMYCVDRYSRIRETSTWPVRGSCRLSFADKRDVTLSASCRIMLPFIYGQDVQLLFAKRGGITLSTDKRYVTLGTSCISVHTAVWVLRVKHVLLFADWRCVTLVLRVLECTLLFAGKRYVTLGTSCIRVHDANIIYG